MVLPRQFYARSTQKVARELLGQLLCHQLDDETLLVAKIVETEAYDGPSDTACHGAKGLTARTEVLFGEPGHAYVYLIYGMYELFNIVTDKKNYPAGVLIRAVEPVVAEDRMRLLREVKGKQLTNGPGKLTRAMAITRQYHGYDLTLGRRLWIEGAAMISDEAVATGPRIGIDYADDYHRNIQWRYWIKDNPWVSKA